MFSISFTNKFKKDIKLCQKRKYDFSELKLLIQTLEESGKLPTKHRPHKLSGDYKNHWECHIKPDWLLIWLQDDDVKGIVLVRTGTHSDLF